MNIHYDNIVRALRADILNGTFSAGSTLPPVANLSQRFGVGVFSVRHALSILRNEGALSIKKHVGAIVTGQHLIRRKGRILFVTVGRKNNFFDATFAERLSVFIRNANWEFTDVVIEAVDENKRDLSQLKHEITYGVDYAIMNCASSRVAALLDECGIRYAVTRGLRTSDFPNADACFTTNSTNYIQKILETIRQQKIATILEVDFKRDYDHALTLAFQHRGLHVRRIWGQGRNWKVCGMRLVEQIGLDIVLRYFSDKRNLRQPPDLIVFMDDYLARGGLTALSAVGLKSPEDIKILCMANHGNPPTYPCKITCFEVDPEQQARHVAKWVLARISHKKTTPATLPGIKFIKGETL